MIEEAAGDFGKERDPAWACGFEGCGRASRQGISGGSGVSHAKQVSAEEAHSERSVVLSGSLNQHRPVAQTHQLWLCWAWSLSVELLTVLWSRQFEVIAVYAQIKTVVKSVPRTLVVCPIIHPLVLSRAQGRQWFLVLKRIK